MVVRLLGLRLGVVGRGNDHRVHRPTDHRPLHRRLHLDEGHSRPMRAPPQGNLFSEPQIEKIDILAEKIPG